MSAVVFHPRHPGWGRLGRALRDLEQQPNPEALTGLDDLDPDVVAAFAHRTVKETDR